jgi:hypothetical protein
MKANPTVTIVLKEATLRDYFAGQVISQCQITVTQEEAEPHPAVVKVYAERYARAAYAIADAMMAEREGATPEWRNDGSSKRRREMKEQMFNKDQMEAMEEQERAAHTSGPWAVDGEGMTIGTACSHEHGVCQEITAPCVAVSDTISKATAQANARLIAFAPELLAFVNQVAHLMPTREPEQATRSVIDRAIYNARHLVDKVTGS